MMIEYILDDRVIHRSFDNLLTIVGDELVLCGVNYSVRSRKVDLDEKVVVVKLKKKSDES